MNYKINKLLMGIVLVVLSMRMIKIKNIINIVCLSNFKNNKKQIP